MQKNGRQPAATAITAMERLPKRNLLYPCILGLLAEACGLFASTVQIPDSNRSKATSDSAIHVDDRIVLWSSDFERGDIFSWYFPSTTADGSNGGGEFDSGLAFSVPSQNYAHSGTWSLEMTITMPPESGTRMFRWLESHTYNDLYYSVWYYFPQSYCVANYWNIFQWKSKKMFSPRQRDPFFVLNVGNRWDGTMFLYLYDWQKRQSYTQTLKDVPVRQWFNVTAHYVCAGDKNGRVTFWQGGTQLFDIANVQTRYSNGDCEWSVNSYSDGIVPAPTILYIDDAKISYKSPRHAGESKSSVNP